METEVNRSYVTFVGSKFTRPQARAATPLQLWETATIPIESGPGCKKFQVRDWFKVKWDQTIV